MAILEKDRRGKHENHAHLDPLVEDSIRKHLDSIPKVDSHYCRADTKRTYIEGGKTVADLHRDYVAECKVKVYLLQNNHYLIAVYIFAVYNNDFINSICHKFLIKGHTQNEGDSVHSVIERQIQRSLKSGAIYTPDQYTQIIRSAKKTVLTQAYKNKMEVCEKKKRGLLGLLQKNTIPKCYSLFYENL
ncbi:hypothetical protein ACJJTC_017586 [Scirpophaga incertulas]